MAWATVCEPWSSICWRVTTETDWDVSTNGVLVLVATWLCVAL